MAESSTAKFIFISHHGDDTWVARQIANEIERCGAQPFLDEADVDVGGEFEEDIRQFLDKADELLVLFTPWAFERPYVWAEIGAAYVIREFQSQPNAPVFLKIRDVILLNDIGHYLTQLGKRIASEREHD